MAAPASDPAMADLACLASIPESDACTAEYSSFLSRSVANPDPTLLFSSHPPITLRQSRCNRRPRALSFSPSPTTSRCSALTSTNRCRPYPQHPSPAHTLLRAPGHHRPSRPRRCFRCRAALDARFLCPRRDALRRRRPRPLTDAFRVEQ